MAANTPPLAAAENDDTRRHLTPPSPSPASPMDLDDLLSEILLRLPPLPSSLPRASLVCTRWRRLVTDPTFARRFRAHHRRPLGVFFSDSNTGENDGGDHHHHHQGQRLSFLPISDNPRYPSAAPSSSQRCFSLRVRRDDCQDDIDGGGGGGGWVPQGCRHGRVVLSRTHSRRDGGEFLVWDPVTGDHRFLDVKRFFFSDEAGRITNQSGAAFMKGAVISATGAGDEGRGHFRFALAWDEIPRCSVHVCVYDSSSATGSGGGGGGWGEVVTATFETWATVGLWNVVVRDTLYWITFGKQIHILQLDLGSTQNQNQNQNNNLDVIEVPPSVCEDHHGVFLCTLAENGGPSLIVMAANLRAQVWMWDERTDNTGGRWWMRGRTIELGRLLGVRPGRYWKVLGVAGDDNLMFVSTRRGVFMVDLESMLVEKVFEASAFSSDYCGTVHPLKNLYGPGTGFANCSLVSISTE